MSYQIVGSHGMLGRAWCELLDERGLGYAAGDLPEINIADPSSVRAWIPATTRVIVNCAAYTNVDGAESDEATATQINGDAVRHLAQHAKAIDALLVHYSTDYVFNGQATEPYAVDTPHDPINAYGRSKAVGERAVFDSGCRYLLIRTSWLYAPWGKNFVRTIARYSGERESLKVVDDQLGRPTSAEHLARLTLGLIERELTGVFHGCDGGQCTWHAFATQIARLAGHAACRVEPCTSAEFPTPAKRPAYSVLDLSKTESALGPLPHWQENLADVMRRLEPVAV